MKTKYTPTATDDDIKTNDLELPDFKIDDQERQPIYEKLEQDHQLPQQSSRKRTFRSKPFRTISIIILLISMISVGIIGYIHYNTSNTTETLLNENQDENERIPQLRSYSNDDDSDYPEIVGQMHIYFRQSPHSFYRRSFEKLTIPVARYNRRHFPLKGPFISLMPRMPVFADRYNKQTIIYSKRSSTFIYVLPALTDKHGKRFSIAELIKSGHVSLSNTGIQLKSDMDMSTYFRSESLKGSNIPRINSRTGGFMDGYHTNYESLSVPTYDEVTVDSNEMFGSEEKSEEKTEDDKEEYNNNKNDQDSSNEYENDEKSRSPRRRYPARRRPRPTRRPQTYKTKTTTTTRKSTTTTESESKPKKPSGKIIDNVAYFQGSNSKNQLGGSKGKVVRYNSIDGLNEYTTFPNGSLQTEKTGIYFSIFAAQIGSPNRNGKGEVHIWTEKDGKNEQNSNSIQTVNRGTTSVLVYSSVFQVSMDQTVALLYSVSTTNKCTSLGLIATEPEYEPIVPSIITTIIQISDGINTIPYAELFSTKTQLANSNSDVIIFDSFSANNKINTKNTKHNGNIEYNEEGIYFIIACAQVGSEIDSDASGEVHLWMKLNDKDMPNSNTIQTIRSGSTSVLISQTIIKLKSNDKVQIAFSSTNKKLGVIASQPKNEPAVPSIIVSTFRLRHQGDAIPYAQLSSSKSQWGCKKFRGIEIDMDDGLQRIRNKNGIIKFREAGTYFVIAAVQVASEDNNGIGDFHLWMKLNGNDIPNSNTIQSINKDTGVLICQSAIEIKVGDKLQMVYSTDVAHGKIGLVATQPHNEPLVPSIIMSIMKSSYAEDNYD
ncbi:unnamed protein product [Adineta steineri]|uniref:Uncharacterized protein n=1 Tax=Adineta steineri TaxID=433720 RepID=A0A813Z7J1_9BILA|nr:unnamed protein product [Adineta steineri]